MVDLVAEALGQRAAAGQQDGFALLVHRLHNHPLRAKGGQPAVRKAQTALLLTFLLALLEDDAGIDQLERAAAELSHIDDDEAAQNAHLRRSDGRSVGGGVQRLQHIVQQLANSVVHLRHLAAGTL